MPSIITSSSEDSESEAFTVESQSDENDYEKIVVSDSDDVFLSEDDEIQKKDKKPDKSLDKVPKQQKNLKRKRNASESVNVKEETENGTAKRKRISVKQESSGSSSNKITTKKEGKKKKTTKPPSESDMQDEKSGTEEKGSIENTQETVESGSGSENEYSEDDGNITEYKPGQLRPTPSPGYGDRVFYESLFEQNPKSFMALKWCVEHGVFSAKKSESMLKELLIRKEEMKKSKK